MAPEQTLGKTLDRRADVFAMGTVLYQLVAGKHPFRGESDAETIQNIVLKDVPPPSRVSSRPISGALEAVILRALERDPARRWATAADLAAALESAHPPDAPRAGATAVAAFVNEVLGDRLRARREALRQAQAIVDGEATPRSAPGELAVVPGEVSARWEIPASTRDSLVTAPDRVARERTATGVVRARAAGPWRAATFALAALLVGLVVVVFAFGGPRTGGTTADSATNSTLPTASVAAPVPSPEPPPAVTATPAPEPQTPSTASASPVSAPAPRPPQPSRAPRPKTTATGTPRFAPPVPSPGF
jgi:serine/threonine-protein kinase